jgi:hypothetical protein
LQPPDPGIEYQTEQDMNRTLKVSYLASMLVACLAGVAQADSKCNNFDIVVENEVLGDDGNGVEVEVTDLAYEDIEDDKWRGETTSDDRINHGSSSTWTKNLSFVGGERIRIQVEYRVREDGAWTGHKYKTSTEFTCVDNGHKEITLTAN